VEHFIGEGVLNHADLLIFLKEMSAMLLSIPTFSRTQDPSNKEGCCVGNKHSMLLHVQKCPCPKFLFYSRVNSSRRILSSHASSVKFIVSKSQPTDILNQIIIC
jgi:hypothetical protein